jgi:signal transduction histidine kinase
LTRSNEELRKTKMELDNFVYSVSHNLRSPLMSVLGLVNLARMSEKEPERIQYYIMMQQRIQSLDETLKDILDYARNARAEVTLEQIDVKRIFEHSLQRLNYAVESCPVVPQLEVKLDTPFYSDPYRLQVIFHTLLSNALRYYDPAKSDPYISVLVQPAGADITLTFRDNGIGIREIYLPQVCNMFFRASERSNGAGLGLYIARECIEKLNGRLIIESKEHEGTVCTVLLPNRLP